LIFAFEIFQRRAICFNLARTMSDFDIKMENDGALES
jgi:hypothetical protein